MGLRRFRIGNDLTVFWAINNRDGSPFDLEGRDVRLYMTHDKGREEVKAIISRLQDGTINNVIRWDFAGAEQRFLGEYKLTAEISESATKRVITKDHCEAFTLVSRSEMEDESLEANISIGGDLIISSRLDIYRFEAVPVDVSALKVQMHEIQNDIEEINNDVGDINDDITNINKDIRTLRDAIQNFTPEIPDIDLSDYYTKKEIDVKVTTINNRIAIFEEWFKDDGNGNIKTTYDFYSTKTLAAGAVGSAGSGEGDGGGGSVNAISVDGVVYSPTDGIIDLSRAFANVKVDLSDYYTKGEVDGKISSIDFTPYLTKDAASNTYATKSDLSSLQGEVDNIESVLGLSESASGYINTWNEVVAFLDGYSQSDDLATILSGINGNVTTLQGYFTEGIANKATADSSGNVITSTYAKQSTSIIAGSGLTGGGTLAADRTINVVSANDGITVNADNIQLNTVNTLTSTSTNKPLSAAQGKALSERIAVFEEWFKDDGSGNIKTTYNFYSTKAIAAGGAGTEGGGNAGGVALLTSWQNIPSDISSYALGANLGVELNSRVTTLEGKATAVSFAQTLTSGAEIGKITIDGITKSLYAPNNYLPLSGGTIEGTNGTPLVLNTTHTEVGLPFRVNNTTKAWVGWTPTHGTHLYTYTGGYVLGIGEDGIAYFGKYSNKNTLIHSGNIGSQNAGTATRARYIETIGSDWYGDNYTLRGAWHEATVCDWEINGYEVRIDRAKKLDTARTIWGQSFDGTGNVSGDLSIGNNSNKIYWYGDSNNYYIGYAYDMQNTAPNANYVSYGGHRFLANKVEVLRISRGGNVGIGTTDPKAKLDVKDNFKVSDTTNNVCLLVSSPTSNVMRFAALDTTMSAWCAMSFGYNNQLYLNSASTKNSYVGINTNNPAYRLDVNGVVRASAGLKVTNIAIECDANGNQNGYTSEINQFGGDLYIQIREGNLRLSRVGGITYIRGAAEVAQTLGVTGVTTLGSTLSVTGATTLKSTLGVTGATTLSSTLSVSGLLTASSGIKIAAGQSITFLDSSGNSHTLSYDSANKAFKFNGNAYATGQIAAGAAGSEEAGSGAVGGSEGAAGALEVDLYTLIGEEGTIAEGTLASVGLTQDALTGLLNGSYTKVVDLSYGVYNYIAYIHSNGYSIYIYRRENIMDDVGETYRITKSDSKYIVSYAEI